MPLRTDQIALIVGGAGTGAAIAHRLAHEGNRVAIAGSDVEQANATRSAATRRFTFPRMVVDVGIDFPGHACHEFDPIEDLR